VFGTAVTERTHALEGNLADISIVITTPMPTYVKKLDNALRLVVQAGLSSAETNYLRRPQVAKFAVEHFVFTTNTRPIPQRLGKFAPNCARHRAGNRQILCACH